MAKQVSEAKINHHRNLEAIIRKGAPSLLVGKKPNPEWILWYRACNGVTTNIALAHLKKQLSQQSKGKDA